MTCSARKSSAMARNSFEMARNSSEMARKSSEHGYIKIQIGFLMKHFSMKHIFNIACRKAGHAYLLNVKKLF